MPEPLLLLIGLVLAAAFVLLPLWRAGRSPEPPADDERDAAAVRHRVALEALRDVEADRRAGSLDDAAYAEQLAQAEARAAETAAALREPRVTDHSAAGRARRGPALLAAGVIGVALVGGSMLPATGIGNRTEVNQQLADVQAAEAERQALIARLTEALAANPEDGETLSDLADAYLAGSTRDDLIRAVVALRLLIDLEPQRADAYERIIAAYIRAGDFANARAAHDGYAATESADPVELAFLDGIIARGEGDAEAARAAFDRFLELAPDDPRAGMVRGLRDEAAP